jgi:hypothetical protein
MAAPFLTSPKKDLPDGRREPCGIWVPDARPRRRGRAKRATPRSGREQLRSSERECLAPLPHTIALRPERLALRHD